jgi:hypothetical protein
MNSGRARSRYNPENAAHGPTRLQRERKNARRPSSAASRTTRRVPDADVDLSLWTEAMFGAEILLLHAAPVYYGFGVPRGDGSAVVIIPGFLGTDLYLTELHSWLARIGYRPYFSGIGVNADCPNLLVQWRLNQTIEKALAETGRKIHLIGHSLGGARKMSRRSSAWCRRSAARLRTARCSRPPRQCASESSTSTETAFFPIATLAAAPATSSPHYAGPSRNR